MLRAKVSKHQLIFKQASGTSRGILHQKPSWFLKVFDDQNPEIYGIGECSIIPGLSPDDETKLDPFINELSENLDFYIENPEKLNRFPSVQFGLEMALLDLKNNGRRILYPSKFTAGKDSIDINGLVWMGTKEFMQAQIKEKLEQGYQCIKLKIGAINFEDEISLLKGIRAQFDVKTIEIRLDANGAFHLDEALDRLKQLSEFHIHSIEQPIKAGQANEMANLCIQSPIPIALDEELIGHTDSETKFDLLKKIHPQYIILKPSLMGGFTKSLEWIRMAEDLNIGWWATSALESNIGLNAIAQWVYTLQNPMPQGLGTGKLFTNNLSSPLNIKEAKLNYQPEIQWDLKQINE